MLPLLLAVERGHNGVETLLSSLSLFLSVEVVCCDVGGCGARYVGVSLLGWYERQEIDKALSYAWYGT